MSWRKVLAFLWAIFFAVLTVFLIFAQGVMEHVHASDDAVILAYSIVFLVSSIAGFRRPYSSLLVILPVPVALYIIFQIVLLYNFSN